MAARFTTIDDYIDSFPTEVQDVLQQVRRTILAAAPAQAGQAISYGIPTITLNGRYLVYFAGWKHHVSVYPVPDGDAAFEEVVAPYRAARGTLRFPLREPVPYDVIARVTAVLVTQRSASER
ncbi:DUF1801 domain-containing protein [Catellatospora citrea]|uniref:iron chaperone n=1 Tax=Catellatospora citrea TaxID=53366 RepID=UPI0033CC46D2